MKRGPCAPGAVTAVLGLSLSACSGGSRSGYQTFAPPRVRDAVRAQRCNARGLQHVEQQEYAEAEEAFRAALEADLFYPAAHNNLGLVLLEQGRCGDYYDAAWEFQFAMKLAPRSPEPRSNLGLVMERVGRWEEAEGYYQDALRIDPGNVAVMGHLARVYVKTRQRPAELETLLKDLALRSEGKDWQDWARQQLLRLGRPVEDE